MINRYNLNERDLAIQSDLAGERPLYIYWSQDKQTLLYSKFIIELIKDGRVPKPLKVSSEGVSFLLQSGVIPPPKTAYENIYIVSIGDTAEVKTINKKIEVEFKHQFLFMNANRLQADEMTPDEGFILEMLAESTVSRIDESKPSFLFHSAGKDSNTIALALAEAGWQDRVTLITHKSKGVADESAISAKIAKQLGFKHNILNEVDHLQVKHKQAITDYFVRAPFPLTDNVTLAYPLYTQQIPELKGANIIDGGGNDSYMTTPPNTRELKALSLAKWVQPLSFMRNVIISESKLNPLLRTSAEWCGMSGLSYSDTKKVYSNAINVHDHWMAESKLRKNWDLFDFKTSILTPVTASELHIRKARNFADSISANIVLPFTNENVASYFAKMPEQFLFDRKSLKNKLILRQILKNRMGLDSDAIGKMGFSYDTRSLILQNWEWIYGEIKECKLWNQSELVTILSRMRNSMNKKGWRAKAARSWIYRLYLISAWFNRNEFLSYK